MRQTLLILIPFILLVVIASIIKTEMRYETVCLESKQYCYYTQTTNGGGGVGMTMSGDMVLTGNSSQTTRVYISCLETDITPQRVTVENKCINSVKRLKDDI